MDDADYIIEHVYAFVETAAFDSGVSTETIIIGLAQTIGLETRPQEGADPHTDHSEPYMREDVMQQIIDGRVEE